VTNSEYTGDTSFTFESREDCEINAPLSFTHFARWGLEFHAGTDEITFQSEILFCAKDPRCYAFPKQYDGVDPSPIRWDGGFHIPVVDNFKYLGSYLSRNSGEYHDVDNHILSAGNAFVCLHKGFFFFLQHFSNIKTLNLFFNHIIYSSLWL
jgi:hypothetical protein